MKKHKNGKRYIKKCVYQYLRGVMKTSVLMDADQEKINGVNVNVDHQQPTFFKKICIFKLLKNEFFFIFQNFDFLSYKH